MVKFGGSGRKKQCCEFRKCIQPCPPSHSNNARTLRNGSENLKTKEESVKEESTFVKVCKIDIVHMHSMYVYLYSRRHRKHVVWIFS